MSLLTKFTTPREGWDLNAKTSGSTAVRPDACPGTSISPMIVTPRAAAYLCWFTGWQSRQPLPVIWSAGGSTVCVCVCVCVWRGERAEGLRLELLQLVERVLELGFRR